MPMFHFDVRYDGRPWSDDDTGSELRDPYEAWLEAIDLMRGIAKDELHRAHEITVRVRDDKPEPVMTLRLSLGVEERA